MKVKPQKTDTYSAEGDASSEDIARRLKLDKGLGFLVRLLDTRVNVLYERLTAQNDITPRQFGVLLTLYQQGTLTLTELAAHIRVDRSTLGEMITRMAERSLVSKRSNGNDRPLRRSATGADGEERAAENRSRCRTVAGRTARTISARRSSAFHAMHEACRGTCSRRRR
jgi:DNA-binding MarR family transcriptional regulator